MKWYKKLIFGVIVFYGVISFAKDYKEFGLFAAFGLLALFIVTTLFLCRWASGRFPAVSTLGAVLALVAGVLVSIFIINLGMASDLHVDVMEVLRASIWHKPWFYVLAFIGAGLKVFIWKWLFSDVREANAAVAA